MSREFDWFRRLSLRVSSGFWRQVPEALFLPGLHLTDPELVEVNALPISKDKIEECKAKSSRRPIDVGISPALCLVRETRFPKAVASRAEAAISLQLRQTLPNGGKGLVWRSHLKEISAENVTYASYILKQEQIDALLQTLTANRVKTTSVSLRGCINQVLWSDVPHRGRVRRFCLLLTVMAALFPALAMTVLSSSRLATISEDLEATTKRIEALQERLVSTSNAVEEAAAKGQDIVSAVKRFNSQNWRLQILADLTETLPDSVWISELTISEDAISLAGFSAGHVSDVLTSLQSISWVSKTQLSGPVSIDSITGESRFQVSIVVRDLEPSK